MLVQSWVDVLAASLQALWGTFIGFIPSLVGALVILIVGLIVASVVERIVERIIYHIRLDALLRKLGFEEYMTRANIKLNSGLFLGRIAYWFLTLSFLLAAFDILKFFALSSFVKDILNYIPSIVVAALIMVATLIFAQFIRNLVRASVMSARLHAVKALGALTWWAIVIFGFLTALLQLGVAVSIVNTLITGLIAMLALAGGLAFGLGGKDVAADLVRKLREEMGRH